MYVNMSIDTTEN